MKMKHNIGAVDRTTRILIGAITGIVSLLTLTNVVSLPAVVSPVFGVIALVMLGTSVMGSCPLYTLFGINTCSASPQ